uniref:mRNA export factor GLE1 n=1 Tax=Oncorhynchus tshawytscha TaxID=74940 RepID=A0A8C8JGX7_ONCTS
MPAESLRWDTLEALKNSPKGRLKYNPDWLEKGEVMNVIMLANGFTYITLAQRFKVVSHVLHSLTDKKQSYNITNIIISLLPSWTMVYASNNLSPVTNPIPSPTISLLSPRATQMEGCIRICEEKHRAKAKMELSLRQELQEKLVASVASRESEQLKRFEELMELKQRQEYQSMRDMVDREYALIGRQEKLKEEHKNRIKILNLRLREAEQQRLREAEFERQRQVEGRERLRALNAIQEEILQLNQLLEPAAPTQSGPSPVLTSYSTRANQLCSQVSEVVRMTAEGEFPSVEDMTVAERALHEMRSLIRVMQEAAAQAQEKRKKEQEEEEERRKMKEDKWMDERIVFVWGLKSALLSKGLQTKAEQSTLKWYQELQDSANQCAQSFEGLNNTKDIQTKKLRMELQKAATIPVSQISSISGSKLREIFDKIDKLLSGRSVVSGGKSVSTSQHPNGLDFVSYKLAEKFVKQGEEEVASHHEAAFPIAVVASGVWELHPKVGDFILAHLHKKCPYAVPHYPPMKDGTSVEEYQKILGYRVEDGGVEAQDSFLKRMSGMIRLYAAMIQLRWPYGSKQGPDPHGLNNGWRWLAQMLNMEPLADVTATLLFDFLEVCGNALMKQYQVQFWKLILLIQEEYLPRIEAVTSQGQAGSVTRLKQFLESSLRSRQIPPPKGQLSSHFWRS